jgi:2-oxoglutarate ferredoxin oxidoreductase subunit beta
MASETQTLTFKAADYKTEAHNDWCPGCGDFGILSALQHALADMQLEPWNVAVFSGIGCSSKTPHFVRTYGVHTLHGRVLPFSIGAKLANPSLNVIAVGGDGDGYGIGAGHFVHAGRRNVDLAYMVFNNEVYGLTKGQASPTLKQGQKPKSLPAPNPQQGINPLAMALAAGYTFIARSYAFDAKHLRSTIAAAVQHRGMALVDVLQPCPTYNDLHDKEWFAEQVELEGRKVPRVYHLNEDGYDGRVADPSDEREIRHKQRLAFERATHVEERVALGVFYQVRLPTFDERLEEAIPLLKNGGAAALRIADEQGRPTTDLTALAREYLV